MNHQPRTVQSTLRPAVVCAMTAAVLLAGCTAYEYRDKRWQCQNLMIGGMYGPARYFFEEAETLKPRNVDNLHDLGACSVMLARESFEQMNHAAAMRELDAAVAYYSQALEVHPAHQASIEGKNIALKLRGQFDEALEHAEWTAEYVGPAAKQYIFLAGELEERGDLDGALLRYRQAVAMEPNNADAHVAFAKFLLRSRNETAAVRHLQAAYRLNPVDEWTLEELAARGAVPTLPSQGRKTP